MRFSLEEPYFKNKAEQLMIQLGLPESDRQRISNGLFTDQPQTLKECMQFIINEASAVQPEIETISPHSDDQEIHEALQQLPLTLKTAVALTVFHQTDQLQELINQGDYEEGISRLSAYLDTEDEQTKKLLMFLKPTYAKKEMPLSREIEQPVEQNVTPEPEVKKKGVRTALSAVLSIGLLSGAMFLLGDPPVTDEQSAGQEAEDEDEDEDEDEPEDEKAFTDEEIAEIEGLYEERKEQLGQALGLSDEEIGSMMITQQADSYLNYIKGMMQSDAGVAGPDVQQMTQITEDMLAQMHPPMTLLQNFYDQNAGIDGDNNIIKSDQAVSMFIHTGADFLMAYDRKLEEITAANLYTEKELRQNHSELFDIIASNGMEVVVDDTGEQLLTSVKFGGAEFEEQADYLHPDYQEVVTLSGELGTRIGFDVSGLPETLPEIADQLLMIEEVMVKFFRLQDELNESADTHQHGYELHLPISLSYEYSDWMRSVVTDGGLSSANGTKISDEYRDVWSYILNENKFENSRLRNVVELNQRIAEKNDYEKINGFGEISISPFRDYIDPMSYFSHSPSVLLPLSGYMEELYNIYLAEGIENMDFLHPQAVILFYLQALETGDIETAYSLMGGENLPDYDTFANEASRHEYSFKRISDVMPNYSSDEGIEFQVQQRTNSLRFTVIESEDWYSIQYESADQFEKLAAEGDSDA